MAGQKTPQHCSEQRSRVQRTLEPQWPPAVGREQKAESLWPSQSRSRSGLPAKCCRIPVSSGFGHCITATALEQEDGENRHVGCQYSHKANLEPLSSTPPRNDNQGNRWNKWVRIFHSCVRMHRECQPLRMDGPLPEPRGKHNMSRYMSYPSAARIWDIVIGVCLRSMQMMANA